MASSVWQVQVQMVSRMTSDAPLRNTLQIGGSRPNAVYNGGAPSQVSRPYLIVGTASEEEGVVSFGSEGNDSSVTLHVYTDGAGHQVTLEVVDHLNRLFHKVMLPVSIAGILGFSGRIRLIGTYNELFNNMPVSHGVVRFEYLVIPS